MTIHILDSEKNNGIRLTCKNENSPLINEPALNGQEFWKFLNSFSVNESEPEENEFSLEDELKALNELG